MKTCVENEYHGKQFTENERDFGDFHSKGIGNFKRDPEIYVYM